MSAPSDLRQALLATIRREFGPPPYGEAVAFAVIEAVAGLTADVMYQRPEGERIAASDFFNQKLARRLDILEKKHVTRGN